MANGYVVDSGLEVITENVWDWVIFGGVWVNREYQLFLQPDPQRQAVIVDLGANVGYYSLYAAHECIKAGQPYKIYAFEANPRTFWTLEARTKQLGHNIVRTQGAVGKRTGQTYITLSENHGTSSIVGEESDYPKVAVDYVDVSTIVPPKIDILKMDIEGSEFDFIQEYPELLRNTGIVYVEIHHEDNQAVLSNFRNTMKSYGLTGHYFSRDGVKNSTEVFYRD